MMPAVPRLVCPIEVYRADDLTLGQALALKFLPPDLANALDRLTRFRKGVAAARRVSHPRVCRDYDIAEADGQAFLTTAYGGQRLFREGFFGDEEEMEVDAG